MSRYSTFEPKLVEVHGVENDIVKNYLIEKEKKGKLLIDVYSNMLTHQLTYRVSIFRREHSWKDYGYFDPISGYFIEGNKRYNFKMEDIQQSSPALGR